MNKRPIPEAAVDDANAVEILSAWIAKRGLHCSLKVGMYRAMGVDEEAAWGRILADIARHIADALNDMEGADRQTTIARIMASFEKELAEPTSDVSGAFVRKN